MNTGIKDQLLEPKNKGKLYRVMVALIVLLSIFVVTCLSLIIFFIFSRESIEPKLMVLHHPSESMVPAGLTQQDLKEAMKLSNDWTKESIKNVIRSPNQRDSDALEPLHSIAQLIASGRIVRISNGTQCVILDSGWPLCQVGITQGPHNGQHYWVYRNCLSRPNQEDPEGPFYGVMCASVYVRYFLTATICCAGIFALKLKSTFMQLLLFVIGMMLLNLLWVRIAMLMMF